jgi:small-conductance mechanosensitive channel
MANSTDSPRSPTGSIVLVAVCIVAFGVFMAIRSEFEQFWVRAAIAGCAGALLGLALSQTKKHWPRHK